MSTACAHVHSVLSKARRLAYPFLDADLPRNGVYVLFESGEKGHGTDRIVRVGSHRGINNLPARLKEHFVTESKDRSIFRKNIGRAILNRERDPFLDIWELDMTTKVARERDGPRVDKTKLAEVEAAVTDYIRRHFQISLLDCGAQRLAWESSLIAIVSACPQCGPSNDWLGTFSPVHKIRESGLWLIQGLNGEIRPEWSMRNFEAAVRF